MGNRNSSLNEEKWALMLCGGLGSRMGSLTENMPKPLLLVYGRPIIWYSFWSLYQKGFRNFVLPLGYLGHMIKEYISDISQNLDCNIHFVDTGADSSIASRIHQVSHIIPDNQDFFLLNTDTIFNFDVESMYKHHVAKKALVTLSSVEVISPWGILTVNGDDIVAFDRGRKVQKLVSSHVNDGYGVVNSGLAWINQSAFELIDFDNVGDFETDLFGAVIAAKRMSHFALNGIWIPIDTPKDLDAINYVIEADKDAGSPMNNLLASYQQLEELTPE
jgi:glucose-1-phosphate cytidylyltransferase